MDYIIGILGDYLNFDNLVAPKGGYNKLAKEEKDNFRVENDDDARYYFEKVGLCKEEALKADTIVSFFTPYKYLVKSETGWAPAKSNVDDLVNLVKWSICGPDKKKYESEEIKKLMEFY